MMDRNSVIKAISVSLKVATGVLPGPMATLASEAIDAKAEELNEEYRFPEIKEILKDEPGYVSPAVFFIINKYGAEVLSSDNISRLIDNYCQESFGYSETEIHMISLGLKKYAQAVVDWTYKNDSALGAILIRCGLDSVEQKKIIREIKYVIDDHETRIRRLEEESEKKSAPRDLAKGYRNRWTDYMFLNPAGSKSPLSLDCLYNGVDGYLMPRAKYKKAGVGERQYDIEADFLKNLLLNDLDRYTKQKSSDRNLVILGLPGIGKSTLVSWFCNAYHNRDIIAYSLPVLVPGTMDEKDIHANVILEKMKIQESELQNKVLILDGLDEASNIKDKVTFIKTLFDELKYEDGLSIIITCRINYINPGELKSVPFAYAILQPWNDKQIKAFSSNYSVKTSVLFKNDTLDVMCNAEKSDLYGIPLIAYMVIATETDIVDTTSEVDVFDRLFGIKNGILDHQIDQRDIDHPRPLDEETKKNILDTSRLMAFWIFENNPNQADISLNEFQRICSRHGIDHSDDKIYTDFFKQIHYIEGEHRIQFAHRTFYEYFVADYLYKKLLDIMPEKGKDFQPGSAEKLARLIVHFGKKGRIEENIEKSQIAEFIKAKLRKAFEERGFIKDDELAEKAYFWFEEGAAKLFIKGMTYYAYQIDEKQERGNSLNEEMTCAGNLFWFLEIVYEFYRHKESEENDKTSNKVRMFSKMHQEYGLKYENVKYLKTLTVYSYRKFQLRFANLRRATLCSANLINADLSSTDLSSADLSKVTLRNADLRFANLINSDLSSTDLSSADLRSADLRSANLKFANLRRVDLRFADLSKVTLRNADLRRADLRSANLCSVNLSSADLRRADLRSADLRNVALRNADLRNADLRSADLSNTDLRSAVLRNADFSSANLSFADLSYAYLREADLRSAKLIDVDLFNADLRDVDLNGAQLSIECNRSQKETPTFPIESIGYAKFDTIFVDGKKYTREEFFNEIAGSPDYRKN